MDFDKLRLFFPKNDSEEDISDIETQSKIEEVVRLWVKLSKKSKQVLKN